MLVDGGMGSGCDCRCWACRTMAWSDSLARAWLATVWLVGTVEVSCGRHSSRLGSERVWLGRVYQGLIARFWWCCRKPRQGTTSLLPVGLRRADKGLVGPRLLGVIAAGSGVGGVKKCPSTVAWVGAAVVAAAGPAGLWLGRLRSQKLGWPPCCWWVQWRCLAAVIRGDWALSESGLAGFARACLLTCVVGSIVIMLSLGICSVGCRSCRWVYAV